MLRDWVLGAAAVAAAAGAARAEDSSAAPPKTLSVALKLRPPKDRAWATPSPAWAPADAALPDGGAETDAPLGPRSHLPKFRLGDSALERSSRLADGTLLSRSCDAHICDDLTGRTSLRVADGAAHVSIGARAKIGDRLDSLVPSGGRSSLYLFVAADAQAMSWSFTGHDALREIRGDEDRKLPLSLDDMHLIGDAQAGLGASVAGGDLAVGFVTREVSHMGASRQESFVGLTFGLER